MYLSDIKLTIGLLVADSSLILEQQHGKTDW